MKKGCRMEEAFAALHQEFLRLQSLCLKQAAMLQHYSQLLQQQPGLDAGPGPTSEESTEHRTPLASNDLLHMHRGLDRLHLNQDGSDPNQTALHSPAQKEEKEKSPAEELRRAEELHFVHQTPQKLRRPWSSSFLDSELLSQAGGLQMSGYMLQSQVCEFCQAMFPGQTHTRGEFLRHLTTHMN